VFDSHCEGPYCTDMNVNLGPEFDQFVADLLKTGAYETESEILREGLRLLKQKEVTKRLCLADLRKEISIGSTEADRGLFVDGRETFAAIRRGSAERKRSKG